MLPSLGFQEIVLLCVLALVVVGPKDLPLMLRKLGRFTAKLRAMANEFRTGMDELARQAELDELRKEVDSLRRNSVISDIDRELRKPVASLPPAPPPSPPAIPHDVAHGAAQQDEAAAETPAVEASEPPQAEPAEAERDEAPMARSAP